jgi:ketosteroid isomerase-like protein
MRTTTAVLAFVSATAIACTQSTSSTGLAESDATAIRTAAAGFQKAVRDTAWSTWANFYAGDAQFGPPNSPAISGHDALLAWARTVPPSRDFTLRQVDVDGRGDLAYVYGKYSWVLMVPGEPAAPDSGKYIEVWRKQTDGNWKIIRDVFNSDVPLPPPPAPPKKK